MTITSDLKREMSENRTKNPEADLTGASRIKPGTCLVRDWRGQSHRVLVLTHGFEYADKTYANLSQIARLITKTRWSGPLFFGLKIKREKGD